MLVLSNLLLPIVSTNGLILLFFLLITGYVYMTRNFGYWQQRQVKEVAPWAFFGNFAKCLLMRKSPRSFMIDMYNAGKGEQIIGYYILDKPHLMVRDPELIKHVLIKDFQDFPNRHLSTTKDDKLGHANIFTSRGPYWRSTRQVMSRFFTSGKMRKTFERMPDVANDLDKYLVTKGVTGKIHHIFILTPNVLRTKDVHNYFRSIQGYQYFGNMCQIIDGLDWCNSVWHEL